MPKSRIPSPARSQSAVVTPRRSKPRGPRSVGSPARSNTSVRLTSVIQNFKDKNMDSFRLSPLNSRRSVLNDNTDIEEPRRRSWWRKLNDTSRDILEVLEKDQQEPVYNIMEEYDVEVLSQEKKDKQETLDLPDSSDSDSISSIVIPQRKLFTQKENLSKNKFAQFLGTRESMAKNNKTNVESDKIDKTIVAGTKKLFGESSKPRSKPAFPTELLTFSPDKTVNKTMGEVKGQVRNLFGNRAGVKRKNKFADFIASESEEEPEIQPKVFGFQKKHDLPSRRVSTASSVTTDIDMDDWKLLPSSTMVQTQLEAMMVDSPVKKARLSKLSEGKEFETATNSTGITNRTKQSNKSVLSKNKSKLSVSKNSNKSKIVPEVNTSIEKSVRHDTATRNDEENIVSEAGEEQVRVATVVQESVDANINKLIGSNKSSMSNSKGTFSKSKTAPNIKSHEGNENIIKPILNEVVPEKDNLEMEVDDNEEIKLSLAYSDEEQMEQENANVSDNNLNKSRQDKLSEGKESETTTNNTTNNTKQSNKSALSKNESNVTISKKNKSKIVSEVNEILGKSTKHEDEARNYEVNVVSEAGHIVQKSVDTDNNKSKNQEMHTAEDNSQKDEEPNNVPDRDQNTENDNSDKNKSNKSILSPSKATINKSKTTPNVHENENISKSILNEPVFEKDNLDKEINDNEEIKLSLEYSDEEPMEQENENLNENIQGNNKVDSDNVANTQEIHDQNMDKKIIHEPADINNSKQEDNEEESPEVQNENHNSDDEKLESEVDEEEDTEKTEEMDEENENQEIELDEPAEKDNAIIDEENASQEIESEEDNEEDGNEEVNSEDEEDIEVEEENESQQDASQELEESHEEVIEEDAASDNEENESQEIINDSVNDGDDAADESDDQNGETNDAENDISGIEKETPNVTHDTTGRNRKKNESDVKSPEVVLRNDENVAESFTPKGRNTSIRRTTMLKSLNIRPSLAPPRESTGISDGTTNSSAEGSGWDSHRTTRKTLRQTFGRDFTPRKSLRALVMEKSAKRHTAFNDINDVDMPRANSTELPEASNVDETVEDPHEISKRTRQTTLEMYLQKIKKQNMEKKKKLEEEVRNSLTAPSKDILNPFKVPSRPFVLKRAKPAQSKPKTKAIKSTIPIENLPQDLLEDMMYKPPKRFQPSNASWITKRLYKFLETKLEPKYDYKARVRAEKLVETIYSFVKDLRRHDVAPSDAVDALKRELARLCVVETHFDFYQFFHDYLPREVRVKVVPDVVNKLPLPRHGVFADILRGNTVQG
ncbi:enolase-phosphatase E1-like [Plodia interpunctella]|uniref:enolase-phosphatase E1-like n=1 Tax=Plodia interpunctella TaxID=58824 RepID=UPI002368E5E6|nr:enolase-phosphatase E1-like [Plodia interpunctella]XP_053606762.1 enolase-phosphatase E1-like [Plodia interpunctella]